MAFDEVTFAPFCPNRFKKVSLNEKSIYIGLLYINQN